MFGVKGFLLFSCCLASSFSEYLVDADFSLLQEDNNFFHERFKRALNKRGSNPNECSKPICKKTTSEMLLSMDHNADACEEFFEMVCGNQVAEKGFTSDSFETLEYYLNNKITYTSEKYLQDFKRFYDSCLQYSQDFGYLRNLDLIVSQATNDLTEVFVEAILTQSMPFFDIGLDIDVNDESYKFVLTLPGVSYLKTHTSGWSVFEEVERECLEEAQNSVASKTVDLEEMYSKYTKCKRDVLLKYAQEFEAVMKLTNKMTDNEAHLEELIKLYQKVQLPQEIIRTKQIEKTFVSITINDLDNKYGLIDWKIFFGKLINNQTITGTEKVLVAFPEYFRDVFAEFKNMDQSKLVNMFQEFTRFQLYRVFVVSRRTDNREIYCMSLAHEIMPDIVSDIVYDLNPTKKIFFPVYQANKIFSDLKDALGRSIEDSTLDDTSKEKFGKKLERLNLGLITVGDKNATRDNYRYMKVRADFQENLMSLLKNYRKFIYSFVGHKTTPASLLNFFISPFSKRPESFYSSDSIVLHPTVFKYVPSDLPEHVRLAKLGFSLAQEIAKHFDPIRRLFMTDNLKSNDDFYDDLVKNMNELFETYYTKTPLTFHNSNLKFKPVNGKLFLNELISDNAAFRLVTDYVKALKKTKELPWINSSIPVHQSFFIAFGQEFCDDQSEAIFMRDLFEKRQLPPIIKIRNIVSNSEYFAEIYKCVEGSTLWLDPSVIRQFPHPPPVDDYEEGEDVEEDDYNP
ncbi:phosphate-regulating neutral endopeptidase PHEX-like isoform X1 [Diabrotica virgifera virgifera]|uniref:Phosphate-regulating neutral endopeptidase PHEX-like isoform X1 n=1 Tax=Diabrotica virgifera virgifera TaxID=50390 RepID=A0A6P7F7P2_DIAVI|nr:phosphate-regulating neutral endopeptidase PHEX-like isoform X1 [Diabrotica virgifera virgifera]